MAKQIDIKEDWPQWKVELVNALNDKHITMRTASLNAGLGQTYVRDLLNRSRSPSYLNLQQLIKSNDLTLDINDVELSPDHADEVDRSDLDQELTMDQVEQIYRDATTNINLLLKTLGKKNPPQEKLARLIRIEALRLRQSFGTKR